MFPNIKLDVETFSVPAPPGGKLDSEANVFRNLSCWKGLLTMIRRWACKPVRRAIKDAAENIVPI